MGRKARHRKPYQLLDYPFPWYWFQWRNRKAVVSKARRRELRAAFLHDLKLWWREND